jgi:hypothetical protein
MAFDFMLRYASPRELKPVLYVNARRALRPSTPRVGRPPESRFTSRP